MTTQTQIENAIDTAFKDISIANGYSFDMNSDRVFEHRAAEISKAWAISHYDTEDEVNNENGIDHALSIEVVLTGKPATPAELRDKMQDIITAMFTIESESFIDYINIDGSNKTFDHEEEKISEATFDFTVYYKCDRGKM